MSAATFKNCYPGDFIKSGQRYRLVFAASFLDTITPGDGLATTYTRIQGGAIAIPISEPPQDRGDVAVIDVRISMQAATMTLSQFANALEDLSSYTSLQSVELLGTTQSDLHAELGQDTRGASRAAAESAGEQQRQQDTFSFAKLFGSLKQVGVWVLVGVALVAVVVVVPRVLPKKGTAAPKATT